MTNEQLHRDILERIEGIALNCEEQLRPMEVDPARTDLFQLFVRAEAAGLVGDESDPDLSAEGICEVLADRWGLKSAAEASLQQQTSLPPEQLARMRSLWSVMRMWMEWTYAWERWDEFHR
jgi:hypothetical protein